MRSQLKVACVLSFAACHGDAAGPAARDETAAVVSVAASLTDVCAVLSTGALYCAGRNYGAPAVAVTPQLRFVSVDGFGSPQTGASGFCALTRDGSAHCWGSNSAGQLGVGDVAARAAPTPVAGGVKFKTITASETHTCGVALDSSTWCWGRGTLGALGTGRFEDSAVPVRVTGTAQFTQVSTGHEFTCALDAAGTVHCWGQNRVGQLADGNQPASRATPAPIASTLKFKALNRRNTNFVCALDSAGAPYCWGNANPFAGGLASPPQCSGHACLPLPTALATTMRFSAITANDVGGMCGVSANGSIACWGINASARFGVAGVCPADAGCFAPQVGPAGFVAVAGSALTNCGLAGDGRAWCWGDNSYGQISDAMVGTTVPAPVVFRLR